MILGLGVDVVEVARFERAVARHGESFLREFLLPSEISRWLPLPMSALHFAAKEALFKALGTGKRESMAWHDVELRAPRPGSGRGLRGAGLVLSGATARRAEELGLRRSHVSLALTRSGTEPALAVAMVLLEGRASRSDRGPSG
jgi:holo-[acyl-carrier protein] synthase